PKLLKLYTIRRTLRLIATKGQKR
ncbi:hypothetical protein LCGC14_2433990, partial [marine sediment metagenome]